MSELTEANISLAFMPHAFDASPVSLDKITKLGARRPSGSCYFAVSRRTWRQTQSAATKARETFALLS